LAKEHNLFLRGAMAAMVRAGQWIVLLYQDVQDWIGLCISPIGVVPQQE